MPYLEVWQFVLYLILVLILGLVGGFFGARALIKRRWPRTLRSMSR
jgi:uncharacterized protein YneF (UPF0154 family)